MEECLKGPCAKAGPEARTLTGRTVAKFSMGGGQRLKGCVGCSREAPRERKEAKSGRAPGWKTFSDSPQPGETKLSASEISLARFSE